MGREPREPRTEEANAAVPTAWITSIRSLRIETARTTDDFIKKTIFPKNDEFEETRITETPSMLSRAGVPHPRRVMTLTEFPRALRKPATFPTSLAVPSLEGGKDEVMIRILSFFDAPELYGLGLVRRVHLVLF
jgi:hypothetical protein